MQVRASLPARRARAGLLAALGCAALAAQTLAAPDPRTEPGTRVHEIFELADTDGGAHLQVSTLYRGADATRRRAELAGQDRAALQRGFLEFYTELYGRLRAARPLEIRDDEARNEIEVRESYLLDELWQQGAALQLWSIPLRLARPGQEKAGRAPLALDPVHVVHEIDVLLPVEVEAVDADYEIRAPGIASHYQARYTSRHLYLRQDYRTLAARVEVDDLVEYGAALDAIEASTLYWVAEASGTAWPPGLRSPVVLGALLAFGGYLGWSALRNARARQRKREFERISEAEAGEAPDRPLAVPSLAAVDHHMSGLSCGCASTPMNVEREPLRVLYMDREVWQQTARCAACATRVTRYFVLDPDADESAAVP
jgi:hypothetical protein